MIQTVEAVVDPAGQVRLLGEVRVSGPRRALVTVLEEPAAVPGEAALLAEAALAVRHVFGGPVGADSGVVRGVDDAQDVLALCQEVGDGERVATVLPHAQRQGFQALQE